MMPEASCNIYHFIQVVDLMKLPKDTIPVHCSMTEVCSNKVKNENAYNYLYQIRYFQIVKYSDMVGVTKVNRSYEKKNQQRIDDYYC